MNKFIEIMEKRVAPLANKFARQRHLKAISKTFFTLIPFMTVGSFAMVLLFPPIDYTTMDPGIARSIMQGWTAFSEFAYWPLRVIQRGTLGMLALWVAIGIAFYLVKNYKMNNYLPVLLAAVCFIEVNGVSLEEGVLDTSYFGGEGLFAAMITTVIAVELYRFLYEKKIGRIQIPGTNVPPVLVESFAALVPATVTMLAMGLLSSIVIAITGGPFPAFMTWVMTPFVSAVDSIWGIIFLSILTMIFWWFGIHDSAITSPLSPFLYANLTANMTAFTAGTALTELPYIATRPFWFTFMAIGGSGATFGLAILLLFSKSKQLKTVGKLGIVPAFFNINEPIIFGVPLMLNPTMFIPFVSTMTLNGIITYAFMSLKIISKTIVDPSWNMFCPIGALIATLDVKAMILILALIVLDMLIYLPFFKVYEKQKLEEERLENAEA